ncbi:MAG: hypothetical protein GWP06_10445 [Actinobacteria bacterium]|nr:hypothetical protein [Actinomycetota bacterium]
MMHVSENKKDLRKFGIVMTVAFGILSTLLYFKGRPAAPFLAGIALFFLVFGLLLPFVLAPIHKVWMKFAEILSWIMNRVVLTLAFFIIITPIGLVMRLLGKDLLNKKFDPNLPTYWQSVELDGPYTRPDKPF